MNYQDSKYTQNKPDQAPTLSQTSDSDDKLWAIFAHLSPLASLSIIVPLIIYLVKKDDSKFIKHHASEALNFHITIFIAIFAITIPTMIIAMIIPPFAFLLFLAIPIIVIGLIVSMILAAIEANKGNTYNYPFTLRLIK